MQLPSNAFMIAVVLTASLSKAPADDLWAKVTPDVVYGHKAGMALTFDVIEPTKSRNGAGVLFMMSGGWVSMWAPPENIVRPNEPTVKNLFEEIVANGFTLFLVRHGSSPQFKVPEAVDDVKLAIRTIRSKAKTYGIDENRLGVCGGSAGGHLSLILGTQGSDPSPAAKDKLQQVSSRVQAVVALYPPTDLAPYLNDADMVKRFPALAFDKSKGKGVSPLFSATKDDAPTLLIHGDKDDLVPISHSYNIKKAFDEQKVPCELEVIKGAGHSFIGPDDKLMRRRLIGWFTKHLCPPKP